MAATFLAAGFLVAFLGAAFLVDLATFFGAAFLATTFLGADVAFFAIVKSKNRIDGVRDLPPDIPQSLFLGKEINTLIALLL